MKARNIFSLLVISVASTLLINGCNQAVTGTHVTIYYPNDLTANITVDAQVELVSPKGVRIFIDVARPELISEPPGPDDILLTTHMHFDHFNSSFAESFPGKQLNTEKGTIKKSDVKIIGIPSSHSDEPPSDKATYYSNMIYLIDIAGLRIAHFGDTGQSELTEKQLTELGKVHIAFVLFWGEERRFFHQVDQLNPHLVFPTHLGGDITSMKTALSLIMNAYPTYMRGEKQIDLSIDDMPIKTSFILLGNRAIEYAKEFRIIKWKEK